MDAKRHNNKLKKHFILYFRMGTIFIILAIILWLLLFLSGSLKETHYVAIHSRPNEKPRELILSDGTKMWINGNTNVVFNEEFKDRKREVKLEGEAYFEIVRNIEKPFYIITEHSITKSIGSSINISTLDEPGNVVVTVLKGSVEFSSLLYKSSVRLIYDEKAILNEYSGTIKKVENNDENTISWLTGKFYFSETELRNVCEVLAPYYNVEFEFENDSIESILISGSFENLSLSELMKNIEKEHKIKGLFQDNKIIFNKCKAKKKATKK
jgi:transmembrane sensor